MIGRARAAVHGRVRRRRRSLELDDGDLRMCLGDPCERIIVGGVVDRIVSTGTPAYRPIEAKQRSSSSRTVRDDDDRHRRCVSAVAGLIALPCRPGC